MEHHLVQAASSNLAASARLARRNLRNRILSILYDVQFLEEFHHLFLSHLPILASQRCGSWYVPPDKFSGESVYFKSTDGHTGKWDFNLRRSNLHLLPILRKHGGCVIIDSTQRGKTLPDSYSRTLPIYCATLNLAIKTFVLGATEGILEDHPARFEDWDTDLHVPSKIVGPSEKRSMEEKLEGFLKKFLNSGVNLQNICESVTKPLRPIWLTPRSKLHKGFPDWPESRQNFPNTEIDDNNEDNQALLPPIIDQSFLINVDFFPIICLSVSDPEKDGLPLTIKLAESRKINRSESISFVYVQGAADDEESWSKGLDHTKFWEHCEAFLGLIDSEDGIERHIKSVMSGKTCCKAKKESGISGKYDFMGSTNVAIGGWVSGKPPDCWKNFDIVINCTDSYHDDFDETKHIPDEKSYIMLGIPEGKKGQVHLSAALPRVISWIQDKAKSAPTPKILCHCAQGMDRSVGVALTILVNFLDDSGALNFEVKRSHVNKEVIQRQLLSMSQHRSKIRPSRATLKRVNDYFMSQKLAPC